MANVVRRHLLDQLAFGHLAAVDHLGQQRIDVRFLVAVGMRRVAARCQPAKEIERAAFAQGVIDREPGLPRLGLALGRVEQLGPRGQAVEVVPFGLERADGRAVLALELDPVDIVEPVREQIVQVLVELPMRQLRAVEQHHRGRDIIGLVVVPRPRHRPDRLALQDRARTARRHRRRQRCRDR